MKLFTTLLLVSLCLPAFSFATSDSEFECMAVNIYKEARGEGPKGMAAVAFVTMNRVNSKHFPETICGVVKQNKQFSWYDSRKPTYINWKSKKEVDAWIDTISFTKNFLHMYKQGKLHDITYGATFYHANYVQPPWAKTFIRTVVIGDHIFYKMRGQS